MCWEHPRQGMCLVGEKPRLGRQDLFGDGEAMSRIRNIRVRIVKSYLGRFIKSHSALRYSLWVDETYLCRDRFRIFIA